MSKAIRLFPTITESLAAEAGFQFFETECTYSEDNKVFRLETEKVSDGLVCNLKLTDPRGQWNAENFDLRISQTVKIKNPAVFFGRVVSEDAAIGIAAQWISTKSSQRGAKSVGFFTNTDEEQCFSYELIFEPGELRGSIVFQNALFLKTPGRSEEGMYAQNSGMILGTMNQREIFIDGNGSVFPIVTAKQPGGLLWRLYFNPNADPMMDPFIEENVEIILNESHPDYPQLKIDSSVGEATFFYEILSSAMVTLINTVKEITGSDWDNIIHGDGFEPGSIAAAVYYFYDKLGWKYTNTIDLTNSVREFFHSIRLNGENA